MGRLKVIARYADGRVIKGTTYNFSPDSPTFHIMSSNPRSPRPPVEVSVNDLKAMFVVKDLLGDPDHIEEAEFPTDRTAYGQKLEVTFKDGEVLCGTCVDYEPDRPCFFLLPADPRSNNNRILVVRAAIKKVRRL